MSLNFADYKQIRIPEGQVKRIARANDGLVLWKAAYINQVPLSKEADGTPYNGGLGYRDNTRLNSSAADVALDGYAVCGYIPANAGDTVRVKGVTWDSSKNTGSYFWTFDSSHTKQKNKRPNGDGSQDIAVTFEGNGVVAFGIANYRTETAYIRLSAYGKGADVIVTVNEEIA